MKRDLAAILAFGELSRSPAAFSASHQHPNICLLKHGHKFRTKKIKRHPRTVMATALRTGQFAGKLADYDKDTRSWVHIDKQGMARVTQVDKHDLVRRLQLPYRDLRQVDPEVPIPYPSGILIRDRALVIKLESIGLIACRSEVYVTSAPAPDVFASWEKPMLQNEFVQSLAERLQKSQGRGTGQELQHQKSIEPNLPYQFHALEAALHTASEAMGFEVDDIVSSSVGPLKALSASATEATLAAQISRQALESTREVQADVMDMITRVTAIKQELSEILDDDQDMADMYLGKPTNVGSPAGEGIEPGNDEFDGTEAIPRGAHPHDIEEAENLLESYMMRFAYMLNALLVLKERILDCEHLVNIELDSRRNELVALNMIIGAVTASFAFVSMIGGIFGMNLSPLPIETTQAGFWSATFGSMAVGICIFAAVMLYCQQKRLLFIPKVPIFLAPSFKAT